MCQRNGRNEPVEVQIERGGQGDRLADADVDALFDLA
jgi:hypothetical protein